MLKTFLKTLFLITLTAFRPTENKLTIFSVGGSTLADKLPADNPETGWEWCFRYFNTDAVNIQNHAVNGRSTKEFITEGRWQKVVSQVKKETGYLFNLDTTIKRQPTPHVRLICSNLVSSKFNSVCQ
ncbi:MAG: hypothetical protein R2822_21375 [Spirosomataceae bacterium]